MILDKLDISVFKNANTEIKNKVYNSDGNPFPIPNATFILTVKQFPFDPDEDSYLIKSSSNGDFLILDANNGTFKTEIVPDNLTNIPQGQYFYDIQMTLADGKKYVIQRGYFNVYSSVTT